MNRKNHLILPAITIAAWLGFYLLGIPFHYFSDWSMETKILLSLVTCFAVVPFIAATTLAVLGGNIKSTALWLSFYASAPLLILDLAMEAATGTIDGDYFIAYWPQSLGYVYVWIVIPLVGCTIRCISGTARDSVRQC